MHGRQPSKSPSAEPISGMCWPGKHVQLTRVSASTVGLGVLSEKLDVATVDIGLAVRPSAKIALPWSP